MTANGASFPFPRVLANVSSPNAQRSLKLSGCRTEFAVTRRWRKMDSNPRSPVGGTTLFENFRPLWAGFTARTMEAKRDDLDQSAAADRHTCSEAMYLGGADQTHIGTYRPAGRAPAHVKERPHANAVGTDHSLHCGRPPSSKRCSRADILNGKGIAQLWCSDCHLVDPQERKSGRNGAHVFIYRTDEIDDRSGACGLPQHPSWARGYARPRPQSERDPGRFRLHP